MEFDFEKLLLPLAGSMVGLIPVLINLTANWADRKRDGSPEYIPATKQSAHWLFANLVQPSERSQFA